MGHTRCSTSIPWAIVNATHGTIQLFNLDPMGLLQRTMGQHKCESGPIFITHDLFHGLVTVAHGTITNVQALPHGPLHVTMVLHHISSMGVYSIPWAPLHLEHSIHESKHVYADTSELPLSHL
jgi:hypothetical protein